jgi:C4-dicarboxylate-specific signal transduction histidine kinase
VTELHHLAESGKLATGFFHDLMNPLTALTLSVEQFSAKTKRGQILAGHVEKAVAASRRVGEFITAIRRNTSVPKEPEHVNLGEELRSVIALLDYTARQHSLALELQAKQKVDLFISPSDFYHIAFNLISFAIEATYHSVGKRVIVTLRRQDSGYIVLEVLYKGATLPDMNKEQAGSVPNLGLMIAKDLIDKTGGFLSVEWGPDNNVVFRVLFLSDS